MRCKGTTKKGVQCKIQVQGDYCRHHVPRQYNKPSVTAAWPSPPDKCGYIYMYTLCSEREAMVFNQKKLKYEKLNHGIFSRLFSPKKILVKVGYTTRTPKERMAQWQAQCKHQLKPVLPKRQRHAPHYDHQKNGWYSNSAYKVEQSILSQLRTRFGSGKVECGSCKSGEKLGQHIEWFLLPVKQLKQVCKIVEASIIRI